MSLCNFARCGLDLGLVWSGLQVCGHCCCCCCGCCCCYSTSCWILEALLLLLLLFLLLLRLRVVGKHALLAHLEQLLLSELLQLQPQRHHRRWHWTLLGRVTCRMHSAHCQSPPCCSWLRAWMDPWTTAHARLFSSWSSFVRNGDLAILYVAETQNPNPTKRYHAKQQLPKMLKQTCSSSPKLGKHPTQQPIQRLCTQWEHHLRECQPSHHCSKVVVPKEAHRHGCLVHMLMWVYLVSPGNPFPARCLSVVSSLS